ncbi:hypothetical protein [Sphingomonas sp.]|uniref:hypothetical protein n=1 Tax=Sphingomonas sp. TaxID=28214 RepID=UPI003AFFB18B
MALRDTPCDIIDVEDSDDGRDAGVLRRFDSVGADVSVFSAVEEQVITLARHDTLASLEPPGTMERAVRLMFGLRARSRALADTRLEALRRAVVVARHRRHMPDPVARDLRERGFRDAQLRSIEARALAA